METSRTSTAVCTGWATISMSWPWNRRLERWWTARRSGTMMGPCPCEMGLRSAWGASSEFPEPANFTGSNHQAIEKCKP